MTISEKVGFEQDDILRAEEEIKKLASNMVQGHRLTGKIFVVIKDSQTGEVFGSFARASYDYGEDLDWYENLIYRLRQNVSVSQIAVCLIDEKPGTLLVCDRAVMEKLNHGLLRGHREGSCTLQGGTGELKVYFPSETEDVKKYKRELCPGTHTEEFKGI